MQFHALHLLWVTLLQLIITFVHFCSAHTILSYRFWLMVRLRLVQLRAVSRCCIVFACQRLTMPRLWFMCRDCVRLSAINKACKLGRKPTYARRRLMVLWSILHLSSVSLTSWRKTIHLTSLIRTSPHISQPTFLTLWNEPTSSQVQTNERWVAVHMMLLRLDLNGAVFTKRPWTQQHCEKERLAFLARLDLHYLVLQHLSLSVVYCFLWTLCKTGWTVHFHLFSFVSV